MTEPELIWKCKMQMNITGRNVHLVTYAEHSTSFIEDNHECGHAIQHAQGYAPLALRSQLVPIVQFSSRMAMFVIIIGLVILASTQNELLCWIGVGMIGVSALFSIITLPVEYNASQRALAWLQSSHTLEGAQLGQAKEALSWAARTYLVAALSAVASLLYYVLMILGRRD